MAQANVKLTVDATQATRALQGVQNKTNTLQKSLGGLKTAITGIGLTVLAKRTIMAATSFEKLNQRLKILTKGNGTYSASVKLAEEAQSKFGLSAIDALEGVTNLQARLGPLGSSMEEITAIFNGFNTAAILSGASAQEQAGAMRQLTQALGSGVLRGDEFNSIAEQMSAVLKPIADQLGVNVGQLRDMAAQGKITKDVVVAAFKEIEKNGSAALKKLIENDPSMVFKVLANETEKLSIAVGTLLAPAVLDAVSALTNLIKGAKEFVSSPIVQTAAIFSGIAFAVKAVTTASTLLAAAQTLLITKFKLSTAGAIAYAKATSTASIATKALAISTGALSIALNALPLVGLATLLGIATTAIIKHRQETKKFNDVVNEGSEEEVNKLLTKQLEIRDKLIKRLEKANGRSKQGLQNRLDEVDADIKLLEGRDKILEKEKEITEEKNKQAEAAKKIQEEQKKQEEQTEALKEKYMEIGKAVEEGVVQNLTDAAMGTQTLGEAAINVLNQLKRKLIEVAIQQAVSGLGNFLGKALGSVFGGGGGGGLASSQALGQAASKATGIPMKLPEGSFNITKRAKGGPVSAGSSYLVGERGPELFSPRSSGMITANNKLKGGDTVTNIVNVSVDASGSAVSGSGPDAEQLGAAIASAVQAQLVKEKRSGGLLAR